MYFSVSFVVFSGEIVLVYEFDLVKILAAECHLTCCCLNLSQGFISSN